MSMPNISHRFNSAPIPERVSASLWNQPHRSDQLPCQAKTGHCAKAIPAFDYIDPKKNKGQTNMCSVVPNPDDGKRPLSSNKVPSDNKQIHQP
jgi:hypothetical protein